MEREDITLWKTIGIQANKLASESVCLTHFIEKYLEPYSEILSFNKNIFEINFSLCKNFEEKKEYLLDWFIKSRLQSLNLLENYDVSETDWDKFSKRIENVGNKSKAFVSLFKKYSSKLEFIGERVNKNEKTISWLYKVQNTIKKREVVQLRENKFLNETTYLILTFRPKKVLVSVSFGDINRKIEGKIKKPLANLIGCELNFGMVKEEKDLSKIFDKIVKYPGIKGIRFLSSKLTNTPHLELVCRKNYSNICSALQELSDKEVSSKNLEDIDFFVLNINKRKIVIQLHHKKIAGYRRAVIFEYNEAKLNEKEIRELNNLGIKNNCFYLDNTQINVKKELSELLNKAHQLNYYEQLAFEDIITHLIKEGLLKQKSSEFPTVAYNINYDKIYSKIIETLSTLKTKRLNTKRLLGKKLSTIKLLNIEYSSENNLVTFFFREPSETTIKRLESKWLDREIPIPIFISLKEEFIQKLTNRSINSIFLYEIVYSLVYEKNLLSIFTSKFKEAKESYRIKYEKDLFDSVKEIESILKDSSGSDRNTEFERSISVLIRSLFRDVIKMGGPNVPDGTLQFGTQNLAIWDAKLWIKSNFCDKITEIDKIKIYCRASKREKIIQEFGGIKDYYLIGKIKDYPDLVEKVFIPIKKELKRKYNLRVNFRYMDVEGTLLKLVKLRNALAPDKLNNYNLYEKMITAIKEESIVLDLPINSLSDEELPDDKKVKLFRKEVSDFKEENVNKI